MEATERKPAHTVLLEEIERCCTGTSPLLPSLRWKAVGAVEACCHVLEEMAIPEEELPSVIGELRRILSIPSTISENTKGYLELLIANLEMRKRKDQGDVTQGSDQAPRP